MLAGISLMPGSSLEGPCGGGLSGRLIRWRPQAGRMLGEPVVRWHGGEFAATTVQVLGERVPGGLWGAKTGSCVLTCSVRITWTLSCCVLGLPLPARDRSSASPRDTGPAPRPVGPSHQARGDQLPAPGPVLPALRNSSARRVHRFHALLARYVRKSGIAKLTAETGRAAAGSQVRDAASPGTIAAGEPAGQQPMPHLGTQQPGRFLHGLPATHVDGVPAARTGRDRHAAAGPSDRRVGPRRAGPPRARTGVIALS